MLGEGTWGEIRLAMAAGVKAAMISFHPEYQLTPQKRRIVSLLPPVLLPCPSFFHSLIHVLSCCSPGLVSLIPNAFVA